MEIREALPVDRADPISYRVMTPQSAGEKLASIIARMVAIGCIAFAIRPLLSAMNSGRFLTPYQYIYYANRPGARAPSELRIIASQLLPWLSAAAAILVIVAASLVAIGKAGFRRLLIIAVLGLTVTSILMNVLALLPAVDNIGGFFSRGGSRPGPAGGEFQLMLYLATLFLPLLEYLIFPVFVAVILSRPAFVQLYQTRDPSFLPPVAQLLCIFAIVLASIGIIWRPLALLGTTNIGSLSGDQRNPLGLFYMNDVALLIWHVLTRFVLWICSILLFIGAILLLCGRVSGRNMMVAQAFVALIVNAVETALIIILLTTVNDGAGIFAGALNHLAGIIPALVLDISIIVYFTRERFSRLLAPSLAMPPPLPAQRITDAKLAAH